MTIDQYGRIRWQTDFADLVPAGASTVYTFQLLATDNRGAAESPVTVTLTVLPDKEAPRGAIQYAQEPGQTDEQTTILVSAVDDVGVTSITLTVDGQNVAVDDRGIGYVTLTTPGSYPAVAGDTTDGDTALNLPVCNTMFGESVSLPVSCLRNSENCHRRVNCDSRMHQM